jgi:1A family penicillin-binding protein
LTQKSEAGFFYCFLFNFSKKIIIFYVKIFSKMAGQKNIKKTRKNISQKKKNKSVSKTSPKKTPKKSVATTQKKKETRGRPSLPFYIKWQRSFRKKIKNFFKEIKRFKKKIKIKWKSFLLDTGLKKGRGRKKLPLKIRWQRFRKEKIELQLKRKKKRQKKQLSRKNKLLSFFGLAQKVGRPKKKKTFAAKLRDLILNFFEKRELFHFKFGRKKAKQIKLSFSYFTSTIFTVIFLAVSVTTYELIFKDLPSATDLTNKEQIVTTRILDRNGKLLYRFYEDENRTLVSLNYVSDYLKEATIAIEDKDFYKHFGFSPKGIIRAFFSNMTGSSVQGGSTITQQLIKNRLLNNEKTVKRKLRELLLSVVVEGVYSKEQIFEMYLNTVAYGGSTYGIEEASWRYFNKSSHNLSLAEASLLAGLPAAPSVYSPFGSDPELAYARQAEVLRRMVEDGYITELQAEDAKAETLEFNQDRIEIEAPHFVMYVRKLLAEKYGEDQLYKGGLEVRTSLDLDLQNQVQAIVSNEVNKLGVLNISNGAAMVTNPKTGEILSMVGGADYFDFAHDGQVNVTTRPRQPGSSIKPLTYALAFENGKTAVSTIEDAPITYQIAGSKPYSPKNYDGKFHGKVTLRESLASSYNIPAVKLLAELGVTNLIDKGQSLGITTWNDRSRFGLSLTLGAGEVRMIDMTELYSSFANLGYPVEANPLLEVKNYRGETLYRNTCALDSDNCYQDLELSPKAAYMITDILSDNNARSSAFGLYSVLNIPKQQVAVKTGTTNNMKDNWTIGYTSDRLVASWVGNNDNTAMSYVASGITGASPIWNKIMLLLLDEDNPHTFAVPDEMIRVKICVETGTLPCTACPTIKEEVFVKGTEPKNACNDQYFSELENPEDRILEGASVSF